MIAKKIIIPFSDVVAHDSSVTNQIAYEYTLLSGVEGKFLSNIYQTLDNQQTSQILE